jgi:hypothetical protein
VVSYLFSRQLFNLSDAQCDSEVQDSGFDQDPYDGTLTYEYKSGSCDSNRTFGDSSKDLNARIIMSSDSDVAICTCGPI